MTASEPVLHGFLNLPRVMNTEYLLGARHPAEQMSALGADLNPPETPEGVSTWV